MKEVEEQALHEKEQLAKHLEGIEADLLEREATFAQINHERLSMESLLMSQKEKETEESTHISEELLKSQNESRRRLAHIRTLEHQQSELNRRLTLAQESILQRDKTIEGLEDRMIEVETNLNETKQECGHREADIDRLQEEKMALEVELKGARDEKGVFDSNLQSLKDDMSRVESSFRQMKADLETKQLEIDELQRENARLSESAQTQPEPEKVPRVSEAPLTAATTDSLLLDELRANKEQLEEERTKLRQHIEKLEDVINNLKREKTDVEQAHGMAEGRLNHMEMRVKQLIGEKAELEGQLLKTAAGQVGQLVLICSFNKIHS
jgi:DNA repair exonuclease SbcCD ATPase subunit